MTNQIHLAQGLYPDLPPDQRKEAIYNIEQYLEVIYQIYKELDAKGVLGEELDKHLRTEWEKRNKNSMNQ